MTEEQATEIPDYEANAEKRHRNFLARAAAAVTGAVAGVVTGKHLLKKSLRQYVHDRLYARDWTGGRLRETTKEIQSGIVDTASAAPTTPENLTKWAKGILSGEITSMPGTLVGDKPTFNAFHAIINEKPDMVNNLITQFEKEEAKLRIIRDTRIATVQAKAGELSAGRLAAEIEKEMSNFVMFTNAAKKKIFDYPLFDEIMKPERMGLKLRHANNKGEIIAFSAGAAVVVGAIAYKAVKSYLHRNDKKRDDPSFQANVVAQREAAQKADQSVSPA